MDASFFARRLIDVRYGCNLAIFANDQFPRHGAGNQREAACLLRRRNHHLTGTEIGCGNAAATALRAVVARGSAVQRLSQNCQPRRNAQDAQLIASSLDDGFRAAWLRRRLENSIGSTRDVFFRPEHSDIAFDLIVVGCHILVADRPVITHAVARAHFEIYRRHTQGDASPVIRSSPDYARAKPAELGSWSRDVRLTLNLPCAIRSQELIIQSLPCPPAHSSSTMGEVVRPHVLLVVARRNQRRSRLKQGNT